MGLSSGGAGDYTFTWYKKNVPNGDYMDEYEFSELTGETRKYLDCRSRNGYTVVVMCVVTDAAGASKSVTFWLRYSPY